MPAAGSSKDWRNTCATSGNNPEHHFAGAGKPITGGKGAVQVVDDYHLSRFACDLIAQNGDPRKPEIAYAQKYFAVQARRQKLSDQATSHWRRHRSEFSSVTDFEREFPSLCFALATEGGGDLRDTLHPSVQAQD